MSEVPLDRLIKSTDELLTRIRTIVNVNIANRSNNIMDGDIVIGAHSKIISNELWACGTNLDIIGDGCIVIGKNCTLKHNTPKDSNDGNLLIGPGTNGDVHTYHYENISDAINDLENHSILLYDQLIKFLLVLYKYENTSIKGSFVHESINYDYKDRRISKIIQQQKEAKAKKEAELFKKQIEPPKILDDKILEGLNKKMSDLRILLIDGLIDRSNADLCVRTKKNSEILDEQLFLFQKAVEEQAQNYRNALMKIYNGFNMTIDNLINDTKNGIEEAKKK